MMLVRRRAGLRKSPVQERSSFTFDSILDAAQRTILDEGVEALQMSTLAKRAGVSAGSLYQYFPDKTSVVMALVDRVCSHQLNDLKRIYELAKSAPLDLFLEHMAAAATEVIFRDRDLKRTLRASLSEGAGEPVDITEACVSVMAEALRPKLNVSEERLQELSLLLVWIADGLLEGANRRPVVGPSELRIALLDAWRGVLARTELPS
jgi:AcrR family transcriptional regulator